MVDYFQEEPQPNSPMGVVPSYTPEEKIENIVGQIDPQRILDNLNHSLKGEYYSKEESKWIKIGEELINDAGRGWIISYFTSILNNASTMGTIDETRFGYLMEGIIRTVTREFRNNLEKFGFVPPGSRYKEKIYENKGTPDTARMDSIAEIIYQRACLVFSRSLSGSESKRIFQSLLMRDNLSYGEQMQPQQKSGWISRVLGR